MTWALRRTPSGRPAHAFQPTMLRKLGPRNGSAQREHLPVAIRELVLDDRRRRVPSAGTSSMTDLKPATHPLQPDDSTAAVTEPAN